MKKLVSLFALVFISVFAISCGNKAIKVLPATELAFGDFVLGGSFRECYEKATNNPTIKSLKERGEGLLNYAEFLSMEIPNYDNPDKTIAILMGEVKSYNDSIYSIKYEAYNDDAIFGMYQAKYGEVEPLEYTYDLGDYHFIRLSRQWVFQNGSINIVRQEREPISILSTLGHHYDGLTIRYSDNSISPIAKKYEEVLSERKDSINHAKEEQERLQKEKEEQEIARIKKNKQNELLKKIRF